MKVRSGTSLWQGIEIPNDTSATLESDLDCEVAVVGTGITGTLVAYYLVREGVDTILLDKHSTGRASTAASTGLLQYAVDTHLSDLVRDRGEEAAVRSYRLGLEAIDELERLAAEVSPGCGFARKPSLYLSHSLADLKTLREEYECRRHFGFSVELLSGAQLEQISTLRAAGGIRSAGDGQLNPLKFTRDLAQYAIISGVRSFGDCEVTAVQPRPGGVLIRTKAATVKAVKVVIATGYAADSLLSERLAKLQSTFAVASAPLPSFDGWPEQCMLWETARPYFYLRATPDGRAIAGGGDTSQPDDHSDEKLLAAKALQLKSRFEEMFPRIPFEPEYVWGGTFAQTADGLAYIGESPELPHAYFALGYGGNGITFAAIAARIITDLYIGRDNSDAHIFRFGR
jgi:glycine/D-amino acid oxidase-like deaminating enzyme